MPYLHLEIFICLPEQPSETDEVVDDEDEEDEHGDHDAGGGHVVNDAVELSWQELRRVSLNIVCVRFFF